MPLFRRNHAQESTRRQLSRDPIPSSLSPTFTSAPFCPLLEPKCLKEAANCHPGKRFSPSLEIWLPGIASVWLKYISIKIPYRFGQYQFLTDNTNIPATCSSFLDGSPQLSIDSTLPDHGLRTLRVGGNWYLVPNKLIP